MRCGQARGLAASFDGPGCLSLEIGHSLAQPACRNWLLVGQAVSPVCRLKAGHDRPGGLSYRWFLLIPCVLAFAVGCSSKETAGPKGPPEGPSSPVKATAVSLTRSVTIPARVVADPAVAPSNSAVLTISEGGDDEPPEGPTSFDLMSDGGFAVTDPLRHRIVFYDAAGKFRFDLLIHIAAERLRVLPNNALSIVRYATGERYISEADSAGNYGALRLATERDPDLDAADAGVVTLLSGSQATVGGQSSPVSEVPTVNVRFSALGENMVSVRRLGTDVRRRTFVAMETAFAGQRVDVREIVRTYGGNGENLSEIGDIPLDYLVHPVDAFRIRDGVLYQLMPKASEVRINIWDTNSRP